MQSGDLLNGVYRILTPIGSGGMGTVFLAWHENLQKQVVVKKIKEHCVDIINIRSEVDILKSLHHMYLPQVYDFVQLGTDIFTVMDYISGCDLKYYLDNGYQFDEPQLIFWLNQLLDVLDYLHTRQPKIIHCDIKPGNIMITEEGNVCLIDFNISLDGENNKDIVGISIDFSSPEQVKKAEYKMRYGNSDAISLDERSDLYSLAAVFYFMMTGILPNGRRMDFISIRNMSPDMNPYSEGLTNIIDKAMQEQPGRRFKSAKEMKRAVNQLGVWTNRYKHLKFVGILLDSATFIVSLILICMMIFGYRQMKLDRFFEAYDGYMSMVRNIYSDTAMSEAEISQIFSEGIQLLNERQYAAQFEDYPDEKSNVLYGVGESALYNQDNSQAKTYLEQAVQYNQENAALYRELAIACIRCLDRPGAEAAMAQAVALGIDTCEMDLIQAEMAMAEEDFETACNYAMKAGDSHHQEVIQKAVSLIKESVRYNGRFSECMDYMIEQAGAEDTIGRTIWLRSTGELCGIAHGSGAADSSEYEKGIAAYESLKKNGDARMTDLYNLACLYGYENDWIAARDLLVELSRDYTDDYTFPLQTAYAYYKLENAKKASERDYTQVFLYFTEARERCAAEGYDWQSDDSMMEMYRIIEDIQAQETMEQKK